MLHTCCEQLLGLHHLKPMLQLFIIWCFREMRGREEAGGDRGERQRERERKREREVEMHNQISNNLHVDRLICNYLNMSDL